MKLLQALRDGTVTFEEFTQANEKRLREIATYYHRKRQSWSVDPDDLFQEASIAAWRAVDAWDGTGRLEGYVCSRVRYACLNTCNVTIRAHQGGPPLSFDEMTFERRTPPLDQAIEVSEMLRTIPANFDRDVFVASMNGFNVTDIARAIFADEVRRERYALPSFNQTRVRTRARLTVTRRRFAESIL